MTHCGLFVKRAKPSAIDSATICRGILTTAKFMIKQGAHLIRTGDDFWELPFLFILPFYYCFDDGGVVRAEIDKDMSNARLLAVNVCRIAKERGKRTAQMASKKANEAV